MSEVVAAAKEGKLDRIAEEVVDVPLEDVAETILEAAQEELINETVDEAIEMVGEKAKAASDKVFEALKDKIKEHGVKKSTLALIIKFTIEAVEETPIKGADQKDYALRLIKALVEELAEGNEKEFLLIAIESGSVGDTIDLIISASRGELNVNKVVKVASTSCLSGLLMCMSKKNQK
jgi:hypothetical protein